MSTTKPMRVGVFVLLSCVLGSIASAENAAKPGTRPAGEAAVPTGTIVGVVYDLDRKPVADAEVTLYTAAPFTFMDAVPSPRNLQPVARTRTDDQGGFSLEMPSDFYHVVARKDQRIGANGSGKVYVGRRNPVAIELAAPAAADVTVKTELGKPIEGATVQLKTYRAPPFFGHTDATGCITFSDLPAGDYTAQVWVDGQAHSRAGRSVACESGLRRSLTYQFKPPAVRYPLDGRVVDADGRPMAGLAVVMKAYRPHRRVAPWHPLGLLDSASSADDRVMRVTRTDADGHFRFADSIRDGRILVSAGSTPADTVLYYAADVPEIPKGEKDLEIKLPPIAEASITVRAADGAVAAGAKIARTAMGDASFVDTDAAGRVTFHSIGSSEVIWAGHGGLWSQAEVALAAGQRAESQITLPRGGSVAGWVLCANGAPAAATELRVIPEECPTMPVPISQMTSRVTPADGSFSITGLPAGTFRLEAALVLPFAYGEPRQYAARIKSDLFTITPGAQTEINFFLPTSSLAVTLVDANGKPASGLAVEVSRTKDFRQALPTLVTDVTGRAIYQGVPAGVYSLSVQGPSGRVLVGPQGLSLDPRENHVLQLQLPPMGTLRGKAVDSKGQPMPGMGLYLQRKEQVAYPLYTQTDGRGEFRVESVPVGHYLVKPEFNKRYYDDVDAGEVTAGAVTDVTITVEMGAVAGRCVDAAGKPIAGAWVQYNGKRSGSTSFSREDGTFFIRNLPPGEYQLQAVVEESIVRKPRGGTTMVTSKSQVRVTADKTAQVEMKLEQIER